MIDIQVQMCERAIELLLLPEDQSCLLLDVGCGSGLSGSVLEDQGHLWIGFDISSSMLGNYLLINMQCSCLLQIFSLYFLCYLTTFNPYYFC